MSAPLTPPPETTITSPPAPALRLSNVGVFRAGRWILQGVDWTVPAGACVAVLGPNGSGKSTLTRVISGYLWPTEGVVEVLGSRFGDVNLHDLRESLRLVQPTGTAEPEPAMTALDVALTGAFGTVGLFRETSDADRAEALRLLHSVGLHAAISTPYRHLSSGERIRCLLARAMLRRPRLLLLDEPTSGLDLLAREQVLATIQSLHEAPHPPTIVLITHHLEELPTAVSHVVVLQEGRVAAQGAPADVLRAELLSRVYQCPLEVDRVDGRFYTRVSPGAWKQLLRQAPPE